MYHYSSAIRITKTLFFDFHLAQRHSVTSVACKNIIYAPLEVTCAITQANHLREAVQAIWYSEPKMYQQKNQQLNETI